MNYACLGYSPCNDFVNDKLTINGFNKSAIDTIVIAAQKKLEEKFGELGKLDRKYFAILFVSCGSCRAKYVIGNIEVSTNLDDRSLKAKSSEGHYRLEVALYETDKIIPFTCIDSDAGICVAISGHPSIEAENIPKFIMEELIRRWVREVS